jgi:hypothetical protein
MIERIEITIVSLQGLAQLKKDLASKSTVSSSSDNDCSVTRDAFSAASQADFLNDEVELAS